MSGLLPGLLDLSVSPSSLGNTKEGESVSLTCQSGCDGAQESFTWFKDGVLLRVGPMLDLSALSPSDSGNYTCSLSAHPDTTSEVKHVDVECEHRKQNRGITKRKPSQPLMANISFQTAPRAHLPACPWRWTVAEMSLWSAAALQTLQFGVMSGLESRMASRWLETGLCWSLVRMESISAAPPTNTEARILLLSQSSSKVSPRKVGASG